MSDSQITFFRISNGEWVNHHVPACVFDAAKSFEDGLLRASGGLCGLGFVITHDQWPCNRNRLIGDTYHI